MKINNKSFIKHIDDIKAAELFVVSSMGSNSKSNLDIVSNIYYGVFIKLKENPQSKYNAVRLDDGDSFVITDNMILQKVNAELTI